MMAQTMAAETVIVLVVGSGMERKSINVGSKFVWKMTIVLELIFMKGVIVLMTMFGLVKKLINVSCSNVLMLTIVIELMMAMAIVTVFIPINGTMWRKHV